MTGRASYRSKCRYVRSKKRSDEAFRVAMQRAIRRAKNTLRRLSRKSRVLETRGLYRLESRGAPRSFAIEKRRRPWRPATPPWSTASAPGGLSGFLVWSKELLAA